jgi:hypothetical protein
MQTGQLAETITVGVEESMVMTVDQSDQKILAMILGKNLYSDGIGSTIRETCSNSLDACREAGVEEPIMVSLKAIDYEYWFKVQDKGVGISPDRMRNVISKYAASTKRLSADQLGMFGLGFKAPLAYTSSFNIETIYDSISYIYNMYEAEEGSKIDLLLSKPTEERNGTTISIKLARNYDYSEFYNKIKEQLCYFEGVYFNVSGIDNNFKIITKDDWKFSELSNDTNMHLCLDNVYYPLDYNKLKIKNIGIPIALNFKTSEGLIPTPNRESIIYSSTVREMILAKIKKVANYLVEEYNKQMVAVDNIFDIWDAIDSKDSYLRIEGVRDTFSLNDAFDHSDIEPLKPSVQGINYLRLEVIKLHISKMLDPYYSRGYISRGKYKGDGGMTDLLKYLTNRRTTAVKVILCEERPTKVMMDYIKHSFLGHNVYLIGKRENNKTLKDYIKTLELKKVPRDQWRAWINEYQAIEKSISPLFTQLKDIVPDEQWLAQRKANRNKGAKTSVLKEEINPKYLTYSRGNYSLIKGSKVLVDDLIKSKTLRFYFNSSIEDRSAIENWYDLINQGGRSVMGLCPRDYKKLETQNIHNVVKIEKFMTGEQNGKEFGKYCTKYRVHQFIEQYKSVTKYKDLIGELSTDFQTKLTELIKYDSINQFNTDLMDYMIQICDEKNLWDLSILATLEDVKSKIKAFDFFPYLKFTESYYPSWTPELKEIAKELLKRRRFKLNIDNYDLPLNDEAISPILTPEIEELTEVTVEELVEEELPF